jgi:hypothetical protein
MFIHYLRLASEVEVAVNIEKEEGKKFQDD